MPAALIALGAIVWREWLRFWQQRSRFFGALVRPLIWLMVFASGFRATLALPVSPPYDTQIAYDVYITPGLVGMIQLFNGMQHSLSLVYDREMGSMRVLLSSPHRLSWLLACRLLAGVLVSLAQVYGFLLIARLWGVDIPWSGLVWVLPALLVTGVLLGAAGMLISSWVNQIENFAGVMNFVVFPVFFLSTALYPLEKMRASSEWLYWLCAVNPFSAAVETLRFALYGQLAPVPALMTLGCAMVMLTLAIRGYRPRQRA